jgi:soluble lytic murein transglycosylase
VSWRRRAAVGGATAALLAGGGVVAWRLGLEEAIREVTLPLRHDDIIRHEAADKDLDPALVAAVIYAESKFREGQTSAAGARGLMQVLPETALAIAERTQGIDFRVSDLDDPDINIRYGTFHLRHLLDAYGGNLIAALAAYNAGSGNVDRWGGPTLTLEDIRFADTRAYVEEVLDKREEYRQHYAADLGLTG